METSTDPNTIHSDRSGIIFRICFAVYTHLMAVQSSHANPVIYNAIELTQLPSFLPRGCNS